MEILQMLPAPGWRAFFKEGEEEVWRAVICFALCRTHEESKIAPMVEEDGKIIDAESLEGYTGMFHESELEDQSSELVKS